MKRVLCRGLMFKPAVVALVAFGIFQQLSCSSVEVLKGVRIRVPEAVRVGDTVKLACDYDLEDSPLYTIKWYRSDEEFYRYVPKESPASKVFPKPGINVDINSSNAREVTLRGVKRNQTGFYKCEVTADAPSFHTEIRSALMIVTEFPDENPILEVEKLKYSLGEKIRANCTSRPSYPATNLTWFINSQQVLGSRQVVIRAWVTQHVDELESARSSIELEASSGVFRDGRMKLRCLATLFTLYRRTEEAELHEDTPQLAPVMGPTAPHSLNVATRARHSCHAVVAVVSSALIVANSR